MKCLKPLLLLVQLMWGCGGSEEEINLAPVSGQVTQDGKGVAGVMVEFFPETGRTSTGLTDAEGNFTLKYSDQEGAVVGNGRVQLTEGMGGTPAPDPSSSEEMMPPMEGPPEIIVISGMFEVKEGEENTFHFELNNYKK